MIRRENQTGATASSRPTFSDTPDANLERASGYNAYDRNGGHMGTVTAIWTDRRGQPAYLGVRTTWLLGKTHVVPAYGATVYHEGEQIRFPYTTEDVKNAPSFDPDTELDFTREQAVHAYYATRGQRLPELQPETSEYTGSTRPETGRTTEEARMALHEEELRVGKRQVEAGGVRLRKIVRTETVNQPVELKREDIVVERVPARERRPGDKAFHDEDLFIPLVREEAVAEKVSHVREEVRARKTASTERQTISGQVRKEDVEIEKGQHHRTE